MITKRIAELSIKSVSFPKRPAHTNYKFETKYSDYLKRWEKENNQQGRFLDQDQPQDLSKIKLSPLEMSKLLSKGKKLPRSYITSDIYQGSLFESRSFPDIFKGLSQLRKNAKLDFYSDKEVIFEVSFGLPSRKSVKGKGYALQSLFVEFPNKFNHPPNKVLAIAETTDIINALASIGVDSHAFDSIAVRSAFSSTAFPFNIIVADRAVNKQLNRDLDLVAKLGPLFPRSQNRMLSGSLPLDEWVQNIKHTRDNCFHTVVSSNQHTCQIGTGLMTDDKIEANMMTLFKIMKSKFNDLDQFEIGCCGEKLSFEFDAGQIEVDEGDFKRKNRDVKKKKKAN